MQSIPYHLEKAISFERKKERKHRSTLNTKENRDNNSYDPPHASPPVSASSSSPYGYPSSPQKCDVKSVHDIKSEHNFSHQRETSENFKNNQPRKSLGGS